MYRNSYQRGMLTVFFSVGSKPLNIWDTHVQDGYITRFLDPDIKSMVLEIGGTNVSTTYMTCPKGNLVLGITMPFLVMIVKNLKKYFSFEVTILDESGTRRRFRVSNFQSTTQILPLCTVMPICLSDGWNQIQFNLAEFTRRAYKNQFVEVQKLKINANIRLRRIYFTERLIPEDQLPSEYKLYFPLVSKKRKEKKLLEVDEKAKENMKPSVSQQKILEVIEEKKGSKLDILKDSSMVSVYSAKKNISQEINRSNIEKILDNKASEKNIEIFTSEEISSEKEIKSNTEVLVLLEEKNEEPTVEIDTNKPQDISEVVERETHPSLLILEDRIVQKISTISRRLTSESIRQALETWSEPNEAEISLEDQLPVGVPE